VNRGRAEIQSTAEKLLRSAGIRTCFKPDLKHIAHHLNLEIVQDFKSGRSFLSGLLLNGNENDRAAGRLDRTIILGINHDDREIRFATAYQLANYVLHGDAATRYESQLTSLGVTDHDDDGIRLANAILMDANLFVENFRKALKGVPSEIAVCKVLGGKFNAPVYSVEQRVDELELQYKFKQKNKQEF